ncbi:hypothetical protein IAR50_002938 [Cryptococcus sp. DSM 104548]
MSHYPRDPFGRPPARGYSPGRRTPPDSRVSAPAPYRPPSYHRPQPNSYGYQDAYPEPYPPPRPRSPYEYGSPQPRGGYADSYDPYQPSASAYDPIAPQITLPPNGSAYPLQHPVNPRPADIPLRPYHAPAPTQAQPPPVASATEQFIQTPSTTVQISGLAVNVYTLPSSHLPLVKYVASYKQAAIDLHQHLVSINSSVWYSGSCTRAGEAWSTGLEWKTKEKQSGIKTRGVLPGGDSLDGELGGILKCVEGFQDALHKSVRNGTTIANELVLFCDSQAAIVAIDSSSRPEAARFDLLWREICNEFLYAHLTLVWIPRDSELEGYVLTSKIAATSAGNSYLKKRKERVLPEKYVRPGTNDPEAPGSTVGGLWQTGNADPSKPQIPYHRPAPVPPKSIVPPPVAVEAPVIHPPEKGQETTTTLAAPLMNGNEGEDEGIQPKEGAIFVTHFPVEASAKDLGILFAQYGEIIAVDIFHISSNHPRFANVTYASPESGALAIENLHQKPISMDSPFAQENRADLGVWERWGGQLTVVKHEPPKVVPSSVEEFFPDLPDWAKTYGGQQAQESGAHSAHVDRKRERDVAMEKTSSRESENRPLSAAPQNKKARLDQQSPPPVPHHELPSTGQNGQTRRPSNPHGLPPRPTFALPPTPKTAGPPLPDVPSKEEIRSMPSTPFVPGIPEDPIIVSAETLRIQISTVVGSLVNYDINNWVLHSCAIAQSIDKAVYNLQGDLAAVKEYDEVSREHERVLGSRGFVPSKIDAFVDKVLGVLDGIAAAEEAAPETSTQDTAQALTTKLEKLLEPFPQPSKNAMKDAGRLIECLVRGKAAHEQRRLELERRVKVMEGMIKVGDVVGGVVRYLLTEA